MQRESADLLISPDLSGLSRSDFSHYDELSKRGQHRVQIGMNYFGSLSSTARSTVVLTPNVTLTNLSGEGSNLSLTASLAGYRLRWFESPIPAAETSMIATERFDEIIGALLFGAGVDTRDSRHFAMTGGSARALWESQTAVNPSRRSTQEASATEGRGFRHGIRAYSGCRITVPLTPDRSALLELCRWCRRAVLQAWKR